MVTSSSDPLEDGAAWEEDSEGAAWELAAVDS